MSSLHFRCSQCGQINRIPADKRNAGPKCGACKTALNTSGAPQVVSDAALTRLIEKSPIPIVVDFYADWCGPCRMLGPVLAQLGRERAGQIFVVKVDTERDKAWAQRVGVSGIPAVHLFKRGRHAAGEAGARPITYWREWLAKNGA